MTYFAKGAIAYLLICAGLFFLILSLSGCTLVSEFSSSSGCMWTKGGPFGIAAGEVLVCRSGKDRALVEYTDHERTITIIHDQ